MHEYSLLDQVIESVLSMLDQQKAKPGETLQGISMSVGALEMHSEESFRQAYQLLTKNTPLENSTLEIKIFPASVKCPHCSYEGGYQADDDDVHAASPYTECPSCGEVIPVLGGKGVQDIELIFACSDH
jgi:Zn finger protein HypA/HybF involved in hydrogenase expression